jgi:class 3 adenylate cyclase
VSGYFDRLLRRLPLRWKMLLYWSTLLAVLMGAMLAIVNYQAERFGSGRIATDFTQAQERIARAENDQLADLRLTALLVASFPDLKALLSTDFATIRDFLLTYQRDYRLSQLLIALDAHGRVVARTDTPELEPLTPIDAKWILQSSAGQASSGVLVTRHGAYNAAAVPATAGGTVFGYVVAGSSIDDAFALALRNVGQTEVVIVDQDILGSTLAKGSMPWRSRLEWEAVMKGGGTVDFAGETFVALTTPLNRNSGPLLVCLQSRDRAMSPYRGIKYGIVGLALVVSVLGIFGSVLLARSIVAPVARFIEGTKQVAAGNFDFRLSVREGDEIGYLAKAFNDMVRGLHEKADMQKFVSQSTVEMIQASMHQDVSAGQRLQVTIFFSDMRGFTTLSERKAPEQVVRMLNACLSLQAEKIRKFHGDIDKYVGDAVVAIFSGDDMALNAIRCGIEILLGLDGYNAEHPGSERLEVGIGIVTGEVVLGSVGSKDRQDFTMIGSNVNLCARLCALAEPRRILMSESTYQLVRHLIVAQRTEPLQVKGFSTPVSVYEFGLQ